MQFVAYNMSADGVPFFTNLQCEAALPWKELTDQLEVGLSRFSKGDIEQPVRVALTVPELGSFVGLMPCYSKADNVISCKIVCVYPQNTQKGISSHIVYVLLFDATTGNLRAFMVSPPTVQPIDRPSKSKPTDYRVTRYLELKIFFSRRAKASLKEELRQLQPFQQDGWLRKIPKFWPSWALAIKHWLICKCCCNNIQV